MSDVVLLNILIWSNKMKSSKELQPKHRVIARLEHTVQKSVHHHLSQIFRTVRTALTRLQRCQARLLVPSKTLLKCHIDLSCQSGEQDLLVAFPDHPLISVSSNVLFQWQNARDESFLYPLGKCFCNIYKFSSNLTHAQGAGLCKKDIMLILGNHRLTFRFDPLPVCCYLSREKRLNFNSFRRYGRLLIVI